MLIIYCAVMKTSQQKYIYKEIAGNFKEHNKYIPRQYKGQIKYRVS